MDSRWKFLHCGMTELWGRIWGACAGKGKTGASAAGVREEKPPYKAEGVTRSELK